MQLRKRREAERRAGRLGHVARVARDDTWRRQPTVARACALPLSTSSPPAPPSPRLLHGETFFATRGIALGRVCGPSAGPPSPPLPPHPPPPPLLRVNAESSSARETKTIPPRETVDARCGEREMFGKRSARDHQRRFARGTFDTTSEARRSHRNGIE